jgi:hypothetical protein
MILDSGNHPSIKSNKMSNISQLDDYPIGFSFGTEFELLNQFGQFKEEIA